MKKHLLPLFGLCLLVCACATTPETLQWQPVSYQHINGWENDRHAEALQAFTDSCKKPKPSSHAIASLVDDAVWKETCRQAQALESPTHEQARAFFERHFAPYRLTTDQRESGLLTGYYIPVFNGSLKPDARFQWPVYARPVDLKDTPYYTRAEIDNGALKGKNLEIAWVDDPVMLFFLHIQGSGRLRLPDGSIVEVRYNGKNNRAYVAIGKLLVDSGEIEKKDVSLQSIRQWLYDHPDQATEIMHANPSYIFFTLADAEQMAPGAQGVSLTPERSLAIDPTFLPYGLPVFIETISDDGQRDGTSFRKMLVTQDTGGAIKGFLRGDIFFGQGEQAEARAGRQKHPGIWTVLIPNRTKAHETAAAQ